MRLVTDVALKIIRVFFLRVCVRKAFYLSL